ncbi:hypothetical protein [Silvimonas sp.]|uniref:hypothetical protein n=1 Tax=Silvimonas sp. TaxID=2650811 RepID=UPI002842DE32|nr:hypothetical protein [Silvimonas sp.]MDR3427840.1 hypothetical protein [Silvimonas sp.]
MAPKLVEPSVPSMDAGSPTSGVLTILPGTNYLVTELWSERYTALIHQYGTNYIPPLTEPRWITPTNGGFVVTSDGMAAMCYLNILSKQLLKP